MTREEIQQILLRGEGIQIGSGGADVVRLASPRARRLTSTLFDHLRSSSVDVLKEDAAFFEALEATDAATDDPSELATQEKIDDIDQTPISWRLMQVRTRGFGGLNRIGGNDFFWDVSEKSWLIEGQNGTGKSSLANAILFAMTGTIFRDQIGVVHDPVRCQPVFNEIGVEIAQWPPIATYPEDWSTEEPSIDLLVELTFFDAISGAEAFARRTIKGRIDKLKQQSEIDPRLHCIRSLIDAGLAMPMRVHHVRVPVEEDNTLLVGLVRQLTGLDPLLELAALVTSLCNGNQRFRRYARDNKASALHARFVSSIGKAKSALEGIVDAPQFETEFSEGQLITESQLHAITEAKLELEDRQANAFATLRELAFEGFSPEEAEHRNRVRSAIVELSVECDRARRPEGVPAILVDLRDLTMRLRTPQMEALNAAISEAQRRLEDAVRWHKQQETDTRLRLKALASLHFDPVGEPHCPLCGQSLAAGEHIPLIKLLSDLKGNAEAAQTALDDACRKIRDDLLHVATSVIPDKLRTPGRLSVKESVISHLQHRFVDAECIQVVPGLKPIAEASIETTMGLVSDFVLGTELSAPGNGDLKPAIEQIIDHMQSLIGAASSWSDFVQAYRDAWGSLMNSDDDTSLAGAISAAKRSVDAAQPYLTAAKELEQGIRIANDYDAILRRQNLRDALADDIRPLARLRDLVNQEAAATITSLSAEANKVHRCIYNREALVYRGIEVHSGRAGKQSLAVHAQPAVPLQSEAETNVWKVDAAELANTSWMRGILWAFVFAIRARAIETAGYCPFPLMVLDEPQLTYDSRNRRGWADYLSKLAGDQEQEIQLLISTHDTEFSAYFLATDSISNAAIERGIPPGGDAQILSGNFAEVRYRRMQKTGSDELARAYIGGIRVLAETMLKYSLESYKAGIVLDKTQNLSNITKNLIKPGIAQRIPPFNNPVFKKYLDTYEKNPVLIQLISDPHHLETSQITVREAEQIHDFWADEFFNILKDIWFVYRLFRTQSVGEAVAISLPANLNHRPVHSNAAASVAPHLIGRVAAYSHGRMSLGALSFSLNDAETSVLPLKGLAAYRLEADTLAPTAQPGDTLLVRMKGSPNPRNLAIEDRGSTLAARRLIADPDVPNLMVLSAASTNPRNSPRAIITREQGARRWKIVGILFTSLSMRAGDQFAPDTEAVPCSPDDSTVATYLKDTSLVEVDGESAEPVALNSQYLLVKPERTDIVAACRELDGHPVVALDEDDQAFFKRLRNVGAGEVALESLDASGKSELVMMSLTPGTSERRVLQSLRPVVGVIFDWFGEDMTPLPVDVN